MLFLISRAHGLRAHLFKTQDFIHLLAMRNLGEMNDYLLKTDYSADLSRVTITQVNALQLERVFSQKLADRWYSLVSPVSGRIRNLLEVHNLRLEVENLKRIVRAVHGKQSIAEEQLFTIPRKYQNVNLHALMIAKTMPDVIELLKSSSYKDLELWLDEYERYGNPIILEAQLDKIYYDDFWSALGKTIDSKKIWALIGAQVDLRNMQLAISSKYMKIEPDVLKKMFLNRGYRLSKNAISRLAGSDLQAIPSVLAWPSYSDLARRAVELVEGGRISEMETIFSKYLQSYTEKMSTRNPNNLVYVFSYLDLCLREAKNLTTLAIGKQMSVANEKLRSLVSF